MDATAAVLLFNYEGRLLEEVAVHRALCKTQRREGRLAAKYWERDEDPPQPLLTEVEVYDAEMS